MPLGRYRLLLRHPGVPRLVVSVLVGRIPIGIFSLAIVLLVRQETDSFAQAGAASAAWALGAGLVAPLQGRLVDRFGQPAVLIPSTLLNATAVAAFVLGARAGASTLAARGVRLARRRRAAAAGRVHALDLGGRVQPTTRARATPPTRSRA